MNFPSRRILHFQVKSTPSRRIFVGFHPRTFRTEYVEPAMARDAAQISSYVDYSALKGLNPTQVFTRPGTDVSAIQGLIDAGSIEQKILPGINSLGVNSLSAADAAAIGSTFGAAGSAIHSLK